jgi:hypothetical protein
MAKEVSLQELVDWVKKNEHRTWWRGPKQDLSGFDKRTLEMKYLRFNLDTRDMKVFSISVEGFTDTSGVDFREDDRDWTVLDLLEAKLDKARERK